jgi:hypothetical protein
VQARIDPVTLWLVALAGIVMLAIGAYSQLASMDLASHNLREYLREDLANADWWRATGCALLGGASILMVAIYALLRIVTAVALLSMIGVLLLLSVGMSFLSPVWTPASVILGLALVTSLIGRYRA